MKNTKIKFDDIAKPTLVMGREEEWIGQKWIDI